MTDFPDLVVKCADVIVKQPDNRNLNPLALSAKAYELASHIMDECSNPKIDASGKALLNEQLEKFEHEESN